MSSYQGTRSAYLLPMIFSGLANFLLGVSSFYWRELDDVSPITLVAYRITLSAVTLSLFVGVFRTTNRFNKINLKLVLLHCIASLLIAINWAIFIVASINGHLLESGLGYLLAPFFSIALGAVIYHESISLKSAISAVVALSSVITLIIFTDNLNHSTYIFIATTWGLYTYVKKSTSLDAVNGLLIETLFLTACLAIAIIAFSLSITYPSGLSTHSNRLIWLAGGVTIVPLLLLSHSAKNIPLSLTGFLQFILPITLISLSTVVHKQQIAGASLAIIGVTICILSIFIIYDIATSQQPKKDDL